MGLRQDIHSGLRTLIRAPGFVVTVVLTLALSIGANTAIFSIANALLLRPLPVRHPDRLVRLINYDDQSPTSWSYPDYSNYRDATDHTFSGFSIYYLTSLTIRPGRLPTSLQGVEVSGNFFHVLGIDATRGRTFSRHYSDSSAPDFVAVITRQFWQQNFGGDEAAIGRTLSIDNHKFTVIGVVSGRAVRALIGKPQIFIPFHTAVALHHISLTNRKSQQYQVLARLKPSTSLGQAQAMLDVVGARLAERHKVDAQRHVSIRPANTLASMHGQSSGDLKLITEFLWAGALLVLLISCANTMNLFLTRAIRRDREIAIRIAMGAGRLQIARQLVVESLSVCLAGATLGIGIAAVGLTLAKRFPVIKAIDPALDARVLLYTIGLTVTAAVIFGVAPMALTLRREVMGHLQAAHAPPGKFHRRLRTGLAIGQIALSAALLTTFGLVAHSLSNISQVPLGFDSDNLLITALQFKSASNHDQPGPPPGPAVLTLDRIRHKLRRLPGVDDVGFATSTPFDCCRMIYSARIPGYTPEAGETVQFDVGTASDSFFRTLGVPIVKGQGFDELGANDDHVVIINQAMKRLYWRDRNPIGSKIIMMQDKVYRVVGVVQDFHDHALNHAVEPMLYWRYPEMSIFEMQLVVRSRKNIQALQPEILNAVHSVVPSVVLVHGASETMENRIGGLLAPRAAVLWCLGVFGGLALLLAAIGLYGVLAYDVAQRRLEIGVRMALGATPQSILWLVLRQVATLAAVGIAIGSIGALIASRLFKHFLFGTAPNDPISFIGMASILIAVALLAGIIPAWRAARLDPDATLRYE